MVYMNYQRPTIPTLVLYKFHTISLLTGIRGLGVLDPDAEDLAALRTRVVATSPRNVVKGLVNTAVGDGEGEGEGEGEGKNNRGGGDMKGQ